MQLIKVTNNTNTAVGTGVTQVPANSTYYSGFSQGAVITNLDGQITHYRFTNGQTPAAVGSLLVEVGLLADNGRFCVQLTTRHGRT